MRLLAGVLAACAVRDGAARRREPLARPMERVARPLRAMGADVATDDGPSAASRSRAAASAASSTRPAVPSAQVKGAILLAALAAEGTTIVREPAPTRDHTERALRALGRADPVRRAGAGRSTGRSSTRLRGDGAGRSCPRPPSWSRRRRSPGRSS